MGDAQIERASVLTLDEAEQLRAVGAELTRRVDEDREWKQRALAQSFAMQLELDSLRLERLHRAELANVLGLHGLADAATGTGAAAGTGASTATGMGTGTSEHALKRKVVKWEQAARESALAQVRVWSDGGNQWPPNYPKFIAMAIAFSFDKLS